MQVIRGVVKGCRPNNDAAIDPPRAARCRPRCHLSRAIQVFHLAT